MIIYLDGEFLEEKEAKVGISDRGFLFGDGVYVSILVSEGTPYFLDQQIGRLKESAEAFSISCPSPDKEAIYELIERNGAHRGRYKLQIIVTGGSDPMMALPRRSFGHLLMRIKMAPELFERPIRCTLYPGYIETPHSRYKTLAHLSRYFVADYARQKGFDDAVTTDRNRGALFEGAFGNLFWIVDGQLFTPDRNYPIHFGITLQTLIEEAPSLGLTAHFISCPLAKVPKEAHLYRSGSIMGIVAIDRIDERSFSLDLELHRRLLELWHEKGKSPLLTTQRS